MFFFPVSYCAVYFDGLSQDLLLLVLLGLLLRFFCGTCFFVRGEESQLQFKACVIHQARHCNIILDALVCRDMCLPWRDAFVLSFSLKRVELNDNIFFVQILIRLKCRGAFRLGERG